MIKLCVSIQVVVTLYVYNYTTIHEIKPFELLWDNFVNNIIAKKLFDAKKDFSYSH